MKTEEFITQYEQLDEAEKRQIDQHVGELIALRQSQPSSLARVIEALNRIQLSEAELDGWEHGHLHGVVAVGRRHECRE